MAKEINLGNELLRICPTDDNKLEFSTNNGRTWIQRYKGTNFGDFNDLVIFGKEIIVVTSKGVYASTSKGVNWTLRTSNASYGTFETIQVNGTELVATTSKGTYISKNEGRTWTKRN
ncbi:MAG: hypothetical protein E6494_07950 [Capnocytophaga sp.]|jgi:hypothetical protein|uniref:Uncharacterized protein related to plant photosystem II stability/assembly factor n=2 Tax=Capnocytophaga TaxID=1016 RepID=A0A2X2UXV9_CAPOC|nr:MULTISPECIES: hypothetical protein [Capnocytophaga]EPD98079.1 hypothetical protein HMPREF1528_02248 [Capnocytophaga sp. oral taxon 336 str. F0502]MBM0651996.1 hypothetical protein [Capnocytophaga genosp. AHN8471]MBM0663103.1 hypothetical protein [Capnocytophaga genosp. AHN8471]MDU6660030.1 hypothetical protein [Capnocytophaga sp.]UZD40379.1 hypothetical protein OL231_09400 [Capnocytophaga ochracea]